MFDTNEHDYYFHMEERNYAYKTICDSKGKPLVEMTAMDFAKSTLTPWKNFAHFLAVNLVDAEIFRSRNYRYASPFLNSNTSS